jgi:sugar lactone lactonase YvrE
MGDRFRAVTALVLVIAGCGGCRSEVAEVTPHAVDPAAEAPDLDSLVRDAIAAHRDGDSDRAIQLSLQAEELLPNHPRLLYNTACAYAMAGREGPALDRLERIAAMQIAMDLESSVSLDPLRGDPRFDQILTTMAANATPVERSTVELRYPDPTFLVEGVAVDPITGGLLLSSLYQRRIVRVTRDGEISDFTAPADDLWSMLGMAVDPDRGCLWTVTVAGPRMAGGTADEPLRSALVRLSLEDGSELDRFPPPAGLEHAALDSVAVAGDGTVYVSDSGAGAIHRLRPGETTLATMVEAGSFLSTQGLELSADGRTLYAADYGRGIAAVDVATGDVRFLDSEGPSLLGIDGLERHGDDLIAIQNGIEPQRVVRVVLSDDGRAVRRVDLLERAHHLYREPTLGTVVGDDLIYVAASQWQSFDENGVLLVDELVEPTILRLPLTD